MKRIIILGGLLGLFLAAGLLSLFIGKPLEVSDLENHPGGKVRVSGQVVGYEKVGNYLVLKLAGRDGFTITATIPYIEVLKLAGPSFQFDNEVVLEGVYIPSNKTLVITSILKGCHSAYYNPLAK